MHPTARIAFMLPLALAIPLAPTPASAKAPKSGAVRADLQEWANAWNALSPEDQQTLINAWAHGIDTVKNLTDEQKAALRSAVYGLTAVLADVADDLTDQQKAAIKAHMQQFAAAYRDLSSAQKQAYLQRIAEGLRRAQVAKGKAAEYRALVRGMLEAR